MSFYLRFFYQKFVEFLFRKKTPIGIQYILVPALIFQLGAASNGDDISLWCEELKAGHDAMSWQSILALVVNAFWGEGSWLVVWILIGCILVFAALFALELYFGHEPNHIPQELTQLPPPTERIIGRQKDLKSLRKLLKKTQKGIVIWGLGGIGKSTLIKAYLYRYKRKYKHIIWLNIESFNRKNENQFSSELLAFSNNEILLNRLKIQYKELDLEKRASTIFDKLGTLPKKGLCIIDNASEGLYDLMNSIPKPPKWDMIVSSRKNLALFTPFNLEILDSADAYLLFKTHYSKSDQFSKEVKELLEYIGYHTLAVECFAKSCENSFTMTPGKLLSKLQGNNLEQINQNIFTYHSGEEKEVFKHLTHAFNLSNLSDFEKDVLALFSVIPSHPFSFNELVNLFVVEEKYKEEFDKVLTQLVKKGWLSKEGDFIDCHQIIKEVVKVIEKPDEERCRRIILGITFLTKLEHSENPIPRFKWIPFAESILNIFRESLESIATLQNNLAILYKEKGEFQSAEEWFLKAIDSNLKYADDQFDRLVGMKRNNLGELYRQMRNFEKSDYQLSKALEIMKHHSSGNMDEFVAVVQTNIACLYLDKKDVSTGKKLLQEVLEFEKGNSTNILDISLSSVTYATALFDEGKYEASKQILVDHIPRIYNHTGETITLNMLRANLAKSYVNLKEVKEAEEVYQKVIDSIENELNSDANNPDLAKLYYDLGYFYLNHKYDTKLANSFFQRSFSMRQKIYGPRHTITRQTLLELEKTMKPA